jgi:hypothetical protein|tara:strand:- start:57 stop:866 length:810 start_codon:yes stop_codon:yes gene_type:complete
MLKNISFLLLNLILINSTFSQINISGTVLSSNLKDSLSYVNIGVLNKDIGSVSNDKGRFELELKKEFLNESLTFSMIGYKSKTIRIVDFKKHKTIILEENITELDEIVISNKKYKSKILGNKKPKSFLASLSFSKIEAGNEIGIKVKVRKPTIIETFNIAVLKNEYGILNLRINFYDLKKGIPNKRINKDNIIISAEVKDGIITADLSKYELIFKDDFFVSVESLKKLDDNKEIIFAGRILNKSFARKTSQGSWNKVKVGFCIFLNGKE